MASVSLHLANERARHRVTELSFYIDSAFTWIDAHPLQATLAEAQARPEWSDISAF